MKARRRKRLLRRLIILVLFAGIVFGIIQLLLFLYVRKYNNGTIMEGIHIGELDVSGLTAAEAEKALEDLVVSYESGSLELRVGQDKSGKTTYGELGLSVDAKALSEEAENYGKTGSLFSRYRQIKKCEKEGYLIPMQYTVDEKLTAAVLEEQCAELFDGPVNASLTRKDGETVITEGVDGKVEDVDATIEGIETFLNDNWRGENGTIEVQSKSTAPDIQAKDLEEIQDLLGTFTTYYGSDGSGRAQNIESGAKLIGGSIVMPGEEFSANAAMEPYTEENGYTEAGSYENGTVVQTMGGGICQVSTTLYNALILAELEITQRQPHSMLVDYVDPSMDAAIADDVKDLKFQNNYDTPVYLESVLEGGYLTFNIYGKETREEGRTVEFVSETLDTEEPEGARYVATDDYVGYYEVISGSRTGASAQLWKVVYENGEEVSREVFNTSYYAASPMTIGVGTTTNNETLKNQVLSAISSQDKETILSAINGGYDDSDEDDDY